MGLLDPKPQTVAGLDAAVTAKINTPGSATATALSATYVPKPAGIADGQVPVWDAVTSTWLPGNGGGGAAGNVHFIISDTAPEATLIDGKDVVWLRKALPPVTATAPTFTDLDGTVSDTYTIPTTTGVDYRIAGVTKAAGTYAATGTVTIAAVAQAGYTLTGTSSWAHTFLTTTDLYPTHAVYDTFTAADGTANNGRTTDKGGLLWGSTNGQTLGGTETAPTITANQISNTNAGTQTWTSAVTLPQANVELSVEYDISTGTGTASERRAYLVVCASDTNADTLSVQLRADGTLMAYKGGTASVTLTGTTTGIATTGTFTVSYNNGALLITTPAGTASATMALTAAFTGNGRKAMFAARGNGAKVDSFRVKYL